VGFDCEAHASRRHDAVGGSGVNGEVPAWSCWCEAPRWTRCWQAKHFGLLQCGSCGSFRIDPPPIETGDDAASFYTDYYRRPADRHQINGRARHNGTPQPPGSRFWRVVEAQPALGAIKQRVADIGCGEGQLCSELQAAGWPDVIGVDVSSARIARARMRHPGIPFHDQPLESIGLAERSFDLIVMDNVIEHLPEPAAMVSSLRRYLKPAGKLVLITPNMTSGSYRLLGRRWTPELAPHAHVFLFTPSALTQLVRKTGLNVDAVGNFHLPIYSPAAYLQRLISGDVKGAVWRAGQEAGGLYGRLIGSGDMLYTVSSAPSAKDAA
jgi:2-polyprenyl-3-methyl-5-hydroxy-6-metoxy-1,4-benzoquinol methylase